MVGNKSSIVWSPEAADDLDRLWDYYAQAAGLATADKIVREIGKVAQTIDEFPSSGRARDEIRGGLRSFATTYHVVFYRLNDGRPEIVRVLDGRRDIDDIFSEDENR